MCRGGVPRPYALAHHPTMKRWHERRSAEALARRLADDEKPPAKHAGETPDNGHTSGTYGNFKSRRRTKTPKQPRARRYPAPGGMYLQSPAPAPLFEEIKILRCRTSNERPGVPSNNKQYTCAQMPKLRTTRCWLDSLRSARILQRGPAPKKQANRN